MLWYHEITFSWKKLFLKEFNTVLEITFRKETSGIRLLNCVLFEKPIANECCKALVSNVLKSEEEFSRLALSSVTFNTEAITNCGLL